MQPNKFLTLPRVLVIAFLAVLVTGIITFSISQDWWKTLIATAFVAVYLLIIIWISKSIWLPEGRGKFLVRLATVGLALTTIGFYMGWQEIIQDLLANYLNIPNLGEAVHPLIVFSFSVLVIWIINFFNRDNTGMGIHPESLDKDIPERDFNERLESVCKSLVDDLRSIDIKTNWSVHNFVPLEAEVELQTDNGLKKKVTDLLKAIKSSKDRLFLVLGDPGSGKSVALRKLCQDLAKEVKKTKKIPIYINLKEWQVEEKWSEENPPTIEQLNEFVLNNIRNRDIVVKRFFDKYYDRLYENGHLYFVFDSFDEIPAVLDEKDSSPLIKQLSEIIFKFLKGARADSSQGILSSRIFRKPTQEFQARTRLEIRPFSDEKIETTLRRSAKFDESLIRKLFKDRTDLIPVARNPFMASLIADYVDNNQNQLPKNQSDLYESYIDNALKDCQDRMDKRGITSEDVKACAIEMADVMFREYGLEAPINILKTKLDNQHVEAVIDVLKFARIGRVGSGDENIFSFAHRRFCEYFAVQKLIEDDRELDLNAIPTDSQWRDALVLYCEVANEEKATAIANFCWEIIQKAESPYDLGAIHSLRFLQDAFKGRLECIQEFREDLANYVLERINEDNILVTKIAIESLGLLGTNDIQKGILQTLHFRNSWLNETALRACRHLNNLHPLLINEFITFFDSKPAIYILKNNQSISFSLKLSEGFKKVNNFFRLKVLDTYMMFIFLSMIILFFILSIKMWGIFILTCSYLIVILIFLIFSANQQDEFNLKTDIEESLIFPSEKKFLLSCIVLFFMTRTVGYSLPTKAYSSFATTISSSFLYALLFIYIFTKMRYFMFPLRHPLASLNLRSLILGLPSLLVGLLVVGLLVVLSNEFLWVEYIFTFIMYSFSAFLFIGFSYYPAISMVKHFTSRKEFLKIDYNRCNTRGYLSKILPRLNRYYKRKLLQYLEANVKNVTGHWENETILKIDDSDETSRLAKLEEKWLGLNR